MLGAIATLPNVGNENKKKPQEPGAKSPEATDTNLGVELPKD
jgi:hypothetical protein